MGSTDMKQYHLSLPKIKQQSTFDGKLQVSSELCPLVDSPVTKCQDFQIYTKSN